ncbi:MAG: four helix bundle protein [Armatimonadota bacterium]
MIPGGSGERDLHGRTKRYALEIIRLCGRLPRTSVAQVLGKQLLRSGTNPGAQYREAQRSRTPAEFVSKLGVALQELEETGYWLELLTESGVVPPAETERLVTETRELTAIFVTIVRRAKARD